MEVLYKACARNHVFGLCAKLKTNMISQDVKDDFSINVWSFEVNQLQYDKSMKVTNSNNFLGDAIRNLDFKSFFDRQNEFNCIKTYVTPNEVLTGAARLYRAAPSDRRERG